MPRPFAWMLVFGLLGVVSCKSSSPTTDFHGVRLGMSPGDVRQRFKAPPGTWRVTSGDEMLVDYSPDQGAVPKVRFEFHSGMLVAIRATVDPNDLAAVAPAPPREVTPGTVLARDPADGKVAVTWLSRDCPTHKDEAERLAGASSKDSH